MSTVWTRPAPRGITAAELDDALAALTAELGPDKVLLGIANEHGVSVWTHGQGRNIGYGGPAPRVKGCVTV